MLFLENHLVKYDVKITWKAMRIEKNIFESVHF